MLLIKIIFRGILHLKYGSFQQISTEEFRDLLIFQNEEYHFSPLHPKALKHICLRHMELRSGLSKSELERRGIYSVSWFSDSERLASDPLIIFELEEYPEFVFSSFSNSIEEANYLELIRIMEVSNIFSNRCIIRCQALPQICGDFLPFSLVVQSAFEW